MDAKPPTIPTILHNAECGFAYHETLGVFVRVRASSCFIAAGGAWAIDILPSTVLAGPYLPDWDGSVRKWWKMPGMKQAIPQLVMKVAPALGKPQTIMFSGESVIDTPRDWSEEAKKYTVP